MNKVFLFFFILLSSNCQSQQSSKDSCNEKNILKQEWLKKQVGVKDKAAVFMFSYENNVVIELHHCFQCPDAMISYYACEGEKICDQGGFMGTNTCPEFDEVTKVKIYPAE